MSKNLMRRQRSEEYRPNGRRKHKMVVVGLTTKTILAKKRFKTFRQKQRKDVRNS